MVASYPETKFKARSFSLLLSLSHVLTFKKFQLFLLSDYGMCHKSTVNYYIINQLLNDIIRQGSDNGVMKSFPT